MKRWHQERDLMLHRWKKEMEKHDYDWRNPPTDPTACHCAAGIGSMRKRTPFDCGNPRCTLCHWSKFYEPKRRAQEKRAEILRELAAENFNLT